MTLQAPTLKERAARSLNAALADDTRNAGAVYCEFVRHVINASTDDGLVTQPLNTLIALVTRQRQNQRTLTTRIVREGIVTRDEEGNYRLTEPTTWPDDLAPRDTPTWWVDRSSR